MDLVRNSPTANQPPLPCQDHLQILSRVSGVEGKNRRECIWMRKKKKKTAKMTSLCAASQRCWTVPLVRRVFGARFVPGFSHETSGLFEQTLGSAVGEPQPPRVGAAFRVFRWGAAGCEGKGSAGCRDNPSSAGWARGHREEEGWETVGEKYSGLKTNTEDLSWARQ